MNRPTTASEAARPSTPAEPSVRHLVRTVATMLLIGAAACLGSATAQVDLTTFAAGDVIRADEVNENFRSLADAAEANQARLDAIASGTVRVGPYDVEPSESRVTTSSGQGTAYDFTRRKSGLELLGPSDASDGYFCFGTGLDLPEGASIVGFAAILKDPDGAGGADAAEAFIAERPWTEVPADSLAAVDGAGASYGEISATSASLPATVENAANAYRLVTCLAGEGGFLGARIEYTLP